MLEVLDSNIKGTLQYKTQLNVESDPIWDVINDLQ